MKLGVKSVIATFVITVGLMMYLPYKKDLEIEQGIRNRTVVINTVVPPEGIFGCTGTMLSHNYVLTNAHCFNPANEAIFIRRYNDLHFHPAKLIAWAKRVDFALIKFEGLDMSSPVDFNPDWTLGQDIIMYGNPGERQFVVGHSRIVGYGLVMTPLGQLREMFVYPCNESAPGFSGSGIYNLRGEYIGTHELGQEIPIFAQVLSYLAGYPRQGPLCYAIPAKEAIDRNLDKPWYGFDLVNDTGVKNAR